MQFRTKSLIFLCKLNSKIFSVLGTAFIKLINVLVSFRAWLSNLGPYYITCWVRTSINILVDDN